MIGLKSKESVQHADNILEQNIVNSANKNVDIKQIEIKRLFQYISLQFTQIDIEYIPIVSWLTTSITEAGVSPYIGAIPHKNDVDNIISRVTNIINGKGVNGTISLEKQGIVTDVSPKTSVEVKLL